MHEIPDFLFQLLYDSSQTANGFGREWQVKDERERAPPVNRMPPSLLRGGGAASESPQIYGLIKESVGPRHAHDLSGGLV